MSLLAKRLRVQLTELDKKRATIQKELDDTNIALRQALGSTEAAVADLSEEEFQLVLSEFNDPRQITVEVVYATREKQLCNEIQLSRGASIEDAIAISGLLEAFPEIDLGSCKVGIHGGVKRLDHEVKEGDRIEIYRPVEASR